MRELKVTFTLRKEDVAHLKRILRRASAAAKRESEEKIVAGALEMAEQVRKANPPAYVVQRVDKLETIVAMARDADWALPRSVKTKVLTALAYFTNPTDLIPDPVPGLGFLDDAIMIELVARDLRHEIKGYNDFRRFRESAEQRPWTTVGRAALERRLADRRRQIRAKIQERAARAAEKRDAGRILSW